MRIEEFPQSNSGALEKKDVPENQEEGIDGNNNESGEKDNEEETALKKALGELSQADAELVLEEFKILNRAVIPNLMNRLGSFRPIEEAGDEVKEMAKADRLPEALKNVYGDQDKLDELLDELNSKRQDLESLKESLINKDIESIKSYREKRIAGMDKKHGAYALSGEEYKKQEDDFNRKLDEENELKKVRDELERLARLN